MSGIIKKATTNLTGLAVSPYPQHTLTTLYGKIMRTLAKMPQDSHYRKYTEEVVRERAVIVDKHGTDWQKIEKEINCGQVEELITQAENELILSRKMLVWKPWEPLTTKPEPDQWKWPVGK